MIIWIIGAVLLLIWFFIWIFNQPYVYMDVEIDHLDKFIYVLLYRGRSDDSIIHNGVMNVSSMNRKRFIHIPKYKERGEIGFKLIVLFDPDVDKKQNILLKELKIKNFDHHIKEKDKNVQKHIIVDLDQNLKKCKSIIKFLWKEIYEFEETKLDVNFQDVCRELGKNIDFKHRKDLEKLGINIDIPIKKWDVFLGKLKIKKFSM